MTQTSTPLARYARILEVLVSCPKGITLTEIAQAVGIQASSAHRLVNALCEVGLVDRQLNSKSYVLGARMLRICMLAVAPPSVIAMVEPELHELVREFSETAYLTQLNGMVVESIATAVPDDTAGAYVQPGRAMPMHATASAKAILAHQDPDFIHQILGQPLVKYTDATTTDPQKILQQLQNVRTQGVAICDSELDPGVLSFAVPVQDSDGKVKYAIGISGLTPRMETKSAAQITASLHRAGRILAAKIQQALH
ncbi:IclR family transcriptional regulator [Phaeovulum sp.]|uniref:IclR family transcriptional regulator n=1 Tax=Phaeovulum sp. TaxID=2934796 RepID=UPI0039E4CEBA